MSGFFSRARKAVVAFVAAFIASLLTAMQNGTVWAPGHGLNPNWATISTAVALALGAGLAVFSARNAPAAIRRTFTRGGTARPTDEDDTQPI